MEYYTTVRTKTWMNLTNNIELKKLCTKYAGMLCDSTPKIMESFPQTFNGKVERVMITIDWEAHKGVLSDARKCALS